MAAAAGIDVIPLPAQVSSCAGALVVDAGTALMAPRNDRAAWTAARYLHDQWSRSNRLDLPVLSGSARADGRAAHGSVIEFRHRAGLAAEGYEIEVGPGRATVAASTAAGLFYGAVTLWQLLPPGAGGSIGCVHIQDAPRYAWRGLLLDSARHMQSAAFIKQMIDWMAWHKLNVLHWHLTDDQGWRLEVPRYPRLTRIGAWRIEPDGTRYGGYYTTEQVHDIVRFAAERHVRIVPEIELPGHATAAIAAYPELGSNIGAPLQVSSDWGVFPHLFNLEPGTFAFLENVLREVIRLFPDACVHIGGDETLEDEWRASPAVQARARALSLPDANAMQGYFTRRMGAFLAAHGRRAIGWDEILQPGLDRRAIVMSWHGVSGAHTAALAGNDAILAPAPAFYLDHRQSTLPDEPTGRLGVVSLESIYRFDPTDAALSATQQAHILGLQANLWTEHMPSETVVQWMALPRAAALAELAWTPAAQRDWPGFLARLTSLTRRYQALHTGFADSVFAPSFTVGRTKSGYAVALSSQARPDDNQSDAGAALPSFYFTLDGADPNASSSRRYEAQIAVSANTQVRAAAFDGARALSAPRSLTLDRQSLQRRSSTQLETCADGEGLLLHAPFAPQSPALAIDILDPCWIDRDLDLSDGVHVSAAVVPLPFNYALGDDADKVRIGATATPDGELEVHVDRCDAPVVVVLPLAPAAGREASTVLPAAGVPATPGRHDLCLRIARPRPAPLWALDWIEVGR